MKKYKLNEVSYIDILTLLYNTVNNDIIPDNEKKIVLDYLYKLEEKLEKYSA